MAGDEDALGSAVRGLNYGRLSDAEFAVIQDAKKMVKSGEAFSPEQRATLERIARTGGSL
jgi:hypothetical protein